MQSLLYQADHLAIPGEGISPSIMMAWGFRHLADDLSKLGKTEYADFYRKAANKTFDRIGELWDDNGYYLSEIDIAGDPNRAHYYTDLVFPVLYSDVPIVNKTLSLLHLLDSLVHRSEATGLCLMQVGEFLPSLFANDNIMPVQLSEAAIALFRMGQCQVAWELLRSCGLALLGLHRIPRQCAGTLRHQRTWRSQLCVRQSVCGLPVCRHRRPVRHPLSKQRQNTGAMRRRIFPTKTCL